MELTGSGGCQQLLEQISDADTPGPGPRRAGGEHGTHRNLLAGGTVYRRVEQAGSFRAEYGKALINQLAADLGLRHGPHYVELLKIDDDLERGFYEKQSTAERWSVGELRRRKASSLFLRFAASKDKAGILQLAEQGQVVARPADLVCEPYVFEFLKIPDPIRRSNRAGAALLFFLCQIFHRTPRILQVALGTTITGLSAHKPYRQPVV